MKMLTKFIRRGFSVIYNYPISTLFLLGVRHETVYAMSYRRDHCCVGLSVKFDSPKGHEKYTLDKYITLFINPGFKLKGDQSSQDFIHPRLL
jgi:hypothetical protein